MAYSGTVAYAHHGTTTAGSVDTITFTPGFYSLGVINHDAAGTLWLAHNAQAGASGTAAPAAEGEGSYRVSADTAKVFNVKDQLTEVRVTSAAAIMYSVEGY